MIIFFYRSFKPLMEVNTFKLKGALVASFFSSLRTYPTKNSTSQLSSKSSPFKLIFRAYPGGSILKNLPKLVIPNIKLISPTAQFLNIKRALINYHFKLKNLNDESSSTLFINTLGVISHNLDTLKYLPLVYSSPKLISGLVSLTDKERTLLTEKSKDGENFREFLLLIKLQIIHGFFIKKYDNLKEMLTKGIESAFSGNPIALQNYDPRATMRLVQHMVVLLLSHYIKSRANYQILKEICDEEDIGCESFEGKEIPIITFIELYFVKRLKSILPEEALRNLKLHLVNNENLISLPGYFNEVICKERTGQKHADIFIHEKFINKSLLANKYYDVKSYVTAGFDYCRFSLYYPNKKIALQLINDIFISLQRHINILKIKDNKKHPIIILMDNLMKFRNAKDPIKSLSDIMKYLGNVLFEPEYESLRISIVLEAGINISFGEFYEKIIKPHIDTIQKLPDSLEILFPKAPIITDDMEKAIDEILNDVIPKEYKDLLEDHLKAIILIDQK